MAVKDGGGQGEQVAKVTQQKALFARAAPTLSLCPWEEPENLSEGSYKHKPAAHGQYLKSRGVCKVNKEFAFKAAFDAQLRFGV